MTQARFHDLMAILSLGLTTCLASLVSAGDETIHVSKNGSADYESIQNAIDAAPKDATIRIGPGVWEESLTITKPITLEGAVWEQTRLEGAATPDANPELMKSLEKILNELESDEVRQQVIAAFRKVYWKQPTITVQNAGPVKIRNLAPQVVVIALEDVHRAVSQRVRQVDERHEEVGDANQQITGIVQEAARASENGENRASHDNAEDLGEAVEEEIVVPACKKQAEQDCRGDQGGPIVAVSAKVLCDGFHGKHPVRE